MGAVKLVRAQAPAAFVGEGDLDAEAAERVRESVARLAKLIGALVAPIVAAEGAEGIRERLGRTLEEVAGRFPSLLSGVALGAAASLDPEPVIERALRLQDDREEQVATALGELVAYLEFEIKNHPAIMEPDRLLAGLAELRSGAGAGLALRPPARPAESKIPRYPAPGDGGRGASRRLPPGPGGAPGPAAAPRAPLRPSGAAPPRARGGAERSPAPRACPSRRCRPRP